MRSHHQNVTNEICGGTWEKKKQNKKPNNKQDTHDFKELEIFDACKVYIKTNMFQSFENFILSLILSNIFIQDIKSK